MREVICPAGLWTIVRLYVLREFYGQGIGKALLWEVDTYFDPKYEVWLDVFENNMRALNFYLSQGYQIMRRATEVQTEGRDVFEFKMRKQRTVEDLANKDSMVDTKEVTG